VPVKAFASAAGTPLIAHDTLIERIRTDFGVRLDSIAQVFGGQDSDAAMLHAVTIDGAPLAVKVSRSLRVGGLLASALLSANVSSGIPAPLLARSGKPYSVVAGRRLSLTPWIVGRGAYEAGMSAHQWRTFGALLSRVHAAQIPDVLADELPSEDYRTPAAAAARALDERIREESTNRGIATQDDSQRAALICDWLTARSSLVWIFEHIDDLGDELRAASAPIVLCHGDAHIGNALLDDKDDIWLLDWDEVLRAPRERDLMFVIEGVLSDAPVTAEQQSWFFDGYGHANIDPVLLAYYRCSWAMQDVADFAARVFDLDDNAPESNQALRFFRSVVSPAGIVGLAVESLQQIGRVPPLGPT